MTAAVRAELLKIQTTKLWWIMLICVFVLGAGYAILPAAIAVLQASTIPGSPPPFDDPGTLRSVYNGGNTLSRILALVIGIMSMGGEYRHKTMATTYLATPHRFRVVAAKAVSLVIFGLIYGVFSVLAGFLVSMPFVIIKKGSFFLQRGDTWRSLLLGVISIALWTLIGMGIAILVRNMILAMLIGIGFAYILEPTLSAVLFFKQWDTGLNLLPSGATNAMLGIQSPVLLASQHPWAWWQGVLVLAGWCLLPAILGAVFTVRRDVA